MQMLIGSGINLAGILGDADVDLEGLMGREDGMCGGVTMITIPTRGRVWGSPSPEKK